jgi:hypothetical protein
MTAFVVVGLGAFMLDEHVCREVHAVSGLLQARSSSSQADVLLAGAITKLSTIMNNLPKSFLRPMLDQASLSNDQVPGSCMQFVCTSSRPLCLITPHSVICTHILTIAIVQVKSLEEMVCEMGQEYTVRRRMLIERAKVPLSSKRRDSLADVQVVCPMLHVCSRSFDRATLMTAS